MIRRQFSTAPFRLRTFKSKPKSRFDKPRKSSGSKKPAPPRLLDVLEPTERVSPPASQLLADLHKNDPSIAVNLHPIDISHPWRLFPGARKLRRKVILHIGPTNSGKSYAALEAFRKAKSGFYAGPLRMLAREIFDRLESENVACNLLTGDEVLEKFDSVTGERARLSAGTVEMADLSQDFDVAVIDEIQMIDDPDRGWAWTKAVLGVRANELHLCGDANSENVIRTLMKQTGDDLEVRKYERLSPLKMDGTKLSPTKLIDMLEPGDCIICFSKKQVKELRDRIVKQKKEKCAIIYGSLPPETRAEQAKLFNDPDSQVNYLVASDAIGMGLNLAIRRIIFTTLNKFNGEEMVPLPVPQIKQIAGRAGRFKLADKSEGAGAGLVNALHADAKDIIAQALKTPSPEIEHAVIQPPTRVIMASSVDKARMFSRTLQSVYQNALVQAPYIRPRDNNALNVAQLYDHVYGLTFEDKLVLANAPVSSTPECQMAFVRYCEVIGSGRVANVSEVNRDIAELANATVPTIKLEHIHKAITLFLWLSYRFPCNFVDREGATDLKELCERRLNANLASSRALERPKSRRR